MQMGKAFFYAGISAGTAIYVFVVYPSGHNESFTSGFSARIDGVPYGGWELANTAPLVNHLAYRNTTMPNAPHNFVMQIQPEWELYFDYVIYTSGDPELSKTGKKFPLGAVVGGIIGGLLVLALISTPFLLRRRSKGKQKTRPFVDAANDRNNYVDKEPPPPPMSPFLLQSPPPAPSKRGSEKSTLRLGIPRQSRASMGVTEQSQSPQSAASESAFLQMTEEMRRLTETVQRLQNEIPEAHDGGPILHAQRPPAYYGKKAV
ncbi:hypothetical protein B0H19DRAFT_1249233 [Mycena capillaripes]|nr:hypothetical protein B0H19DRAFT_1249233 [Mycena capillaripes]